MPCYGCRVAALQVSGKTWKGEAEKRASADKNAVLGSSWEKKMQAKALKKSFQEQKQAAVDAHKEKRKVRVAGAELGWAPLTGAGPCTSQGSTADICRVPREAVACSSTCRLAVATAKAAATQAG